MELKENTWKKREKLFNLASNPWEGRMNTMVGLIDFTSTSSIMDLGCGGGRLRELLPDCMTYIPVDYKLRDGVDDIVICDFNNDEFPNIDADVAFMAGILEYIHDPAAFISDICRHCNTVIISYNEYHFWKMTKKKRESIGWINHLSRKRFVEMFINSGFELTGWAHKRGQGPVFRFDKR